jgi:23S rRNA pseudouridine1911/1915/1917 synthase
MPRFIVEQCSTGERLDKFLTEQTGESRSQIQKMIKAGLVLVNEKLAKPHQVLRIGDAVEISSKLEVPSSKENPNRNFTNVEKTLNADLAIIKQTYWQRIKKKIQKFFSVLFVSSSNKPAAPKIIAETRDYLIIDKPAGLLVHATENSIEPTLVDWLVKKYPEIKKISDSESLARGDLTYRPGIVHRLDKDVSGVMLIARNQTAFDYFKKQFQTKQVQKEYLGLVNGELPKDAGVIEFEISRKTGEGRMACHPKGSGKGKPAITEYSVEQRLKNYTLVKIQPLTGRTNQIRAHFFSINHPIAGDKVYKMNDKPASTRLMLHAAKLSFVDLNCKTQSFESPMPIEFQFYVTY